LKIRIHEKIYSVNNFSLLDVLNFLFRFRFILSAFIFIIYIVNAINGLNIDCKGLLIALENFGLKDLINMKFRIGMHYLDGIDGNFIGNKDSISNNIFANNNDNENANNNDNGNNSNQNNNNSNENDRGSSPVDVTNMPRHLTPIEGANESSDDGEYVNSSDEGEKEPSAANG